MNPLSRCSKKKKEKKRTICTHHKGHLRWLSQQNPSALCFNCPWTRHCSSPSGSGGNFLKLLHCGEEHIIVPPLFSRWYKECVIWIYIILRAAAKPLNINSFDSSRAQIQAEGRVLISYTVVSLSFSPALLCSSHTVLRFTITRPCMFSTESVLVSKSLGSTGVNDVYVLFLLVQN